MTQIWQRDAQKGQQLQPSRAFVYKSLKKDTHWQAVPMGVRRCPPQVCPVPWEKERNGHARSSGFLAASFSKLRRQQEDPARPPLSAPSYSSEQDRRGIFYPASAGAPASGCGSRKSQQGCSVSHADQKGMEMHGLSGSSSFPAGFSHLEKPSAEAGRPGKAMRKPPISLPSITAPQREPLHRRRCWCQR